MMAFFDWLAGELQSYAAAVEQGAAEQWLIGKGYSQDYRVLKLNHGQMLHDHIYSHYSDLKKDIYECTACGRILVETAGNQFASYAPDSGNVNRGLVGGRNEP